MPDGKPFVVRCRARRSMRAWCADPACTFSAQSNDRLTYGAVQSRARAHRIKTGHEVRIDTRTDAQTFYPAATS